MLKQKLFLLIVGVLVSSLWAEARPFWGNRDENDTVADSDYVYPSDWENKWDISKPVEPDNSDMLPPVFWVYDNKKTESDDSSQRYSLWP